MHERGFGDPDVSIVVSCNAEGSDHYQTTPQASNRVLAGLPQLTFLKSRFFRGYVKACEGQPESLLFVILAIPLVGAGSS